MEPKSPRAMPALRGTVRAQSSFLAAKVGPRRPCEAGSRSGLLHFNMSALSAAAAPLNGGDETAGFIRPGSYRRYCRRELATIRQCFAFARQLGVVPALAYELRCTFVCAYMHSCALTWREKPRQAPCPRRSPPTERARSLSIVPTVSLATLAGIPWMNPEVARMVDVF
jgi:hypothetical protein